MASDGFHVHAPTMTVALLRQAAQVVEEASKDLPGETVYFPPKEMEEGQPTRLEGYVTLSDIGGLIHYLADMLEA